WGFLRGGGRAPPGRAPRTRRRRPDRRLARRRERGSDEQQREAVDGVVARRLPAEEVEDALRDGGLLDELDAEGGRLRRAVGERPGAGRLAVVQVEGELD